MLVSTISNWKTQIKRLFVCFVNQTILIRCEPSLNYCNSRMVLIVKVTIDLIIENILKKAVKNKMPDC
ncbi:MAG: hypothetical protein JWP44_2630 [Mucilaginibacter sp.]|nr:hypothetical protein [Mucilaginibacter sp.]